MATVGAGFIEGPPHLSWGWGEIVTVACALFFALHIIFTQRLTLALDPLMLTLTSFIVVGLHPWRWRSAPATNPPTCWLTLSLERVSCCP